MKYPVNLWHVSRRLGDLMHLRLDIGILTPNRTPDYGTGEVQSKLTCWPLGTCHFKIVKDAVSVLNEYRMA